jgi:hypothetical protein
MSRFVVVAAGRFKIHAASWDDLAVSEHLRRLVTRI